MRSMTGYGQSAGEDGRHRISVTLRSVNSRYLDLVVRIKEEFRGLESMIRRALEGDLERGRVDASVEIRSLQPLPAEVEIQTEVVLALHRASHEMAERGLVSSVLSAGDLLRLPEVVEVRVAPDSLDASGEALLEEQLRSAVTELLASRDAEGAQLLGVLGERLTSLTTIVDRLGERVEGLRSEIESRLRLRLETLSKDLEIDENRLAQEVAILVDKSDVSEELDRLVGHVAQFRAALEGEGAIGRRLDFLAQELMRELNTLGSKARDGEVAGWILEGKLICEQLREQIQNVE